MFLHRDEVNIHYGIRYFGGNPNMAIFLRPILLLLNPSINMRPDSTASKKFEDHTLLL